MQLFEVVRHMKIEGYEDIHISISAGITMILHAEPYEQLMKKADQALYRAKAKGRNQYRIDGFDE